MSAVIATEFMPPHTDVEMLMAGWSLCLDAEKPSWFTVDVVVSATQLRLYLKNATTLTAAGKTFRLCPPPFVDAQTGTLGSRDASGNVTFAHAKTQAARLWAGYRYTPPRVGFWNWDSTVIAAQTGSVKLGSHHTDNREYDIYTGRWTTPDPAASPWSNLWDYVGSRPLDRTDPSGLDDGEPMVPGIEEDDPPPPDRSRRGSGEPSNIRPHRPSQPLVKRKLSRADLRKVRPKAMRRTVNIVVDDPDKDADDAACTDAQLGFARNTGVRAKRTTKGKEGMHEKVDCKEGSAECIETLNVNMHGAPGHASWGSNKTLKADDFNNIEFCKRCTIVIYACNVALGEAGSQLLQQIADNTGCRVCAPMNYCTEDGAGDPPDTGEKVCGMKDSDFIKPDATGRLKPWPGARDRYECKSPTDSK